MINGLSNTVESKSVSKDIRSSISVYQNFIEVGEVAGRFELLDEPFSLVVDGIDFEDSIKIFAYHTDDFF